LDSKDRIILEKLFSSNPREMRKDVTSFFFSQMFKYIDNNMVWRCSIMGETRSGKSEVGMMICKVYMKRFNQNLENGIYDDLDVWDYVTRAPVKFTPKFILGSQSDYIYQLRHLSQKNKISFGQIWQIDESKDQIGGLGSFSESIDLDNLNNIVAKFMQSEIWIIPQRLITQNAPYGLLVYKKDIENRVNWCLLYKISMTARKTADYSFMGWVCMPLHDDEKLRKLYNKKKNEWIMDELSGTGNKRIMERKDVAVKLSNDKLFSKLTPSGKGFALSKEQQISVLEDWIIGGKTQNWNELEKFRIVMDGRMLVLKKTTLKV